MDGETSTILEECVESVVVEEPRPATCRRMLGVAFGICCYVTFAAFYFFRPGNPVVSVGQARFTVDSLLEIFFTILALPFFGVAYLHGVRNYEENQDFPVSEGVLDRKSVV